VRGGRWGIGEGWEEGGAAAEVAAGQVGGRGGGFKISGFRDGGGSMASGYRTEVGGNSGGGS
jgi:hypothetical protein